MSKTRGGDFGGYGAGGRVTLSVVTDRATLSGDSSSFSVTLVAIWEMNAVGDLGCSDTLRAACLVGTSGIRSLLGSVIEVLVYCSIRGDGSFFFGAMLVINMSAKCSMYIVALGK